VNIRHLKLYHAPATRSARVKWMLHEVVGDTFDVVKVSLIEGEHNSAAFSLINRNHCVPVLEVTWDIGGSQRILESAAMVAFLADAYPEKHLAPPSGASYARADYLQMLHFGSTQMDAMLWQLRLHERLLPQLERDSRTAARYRKKFAEEVEPLLASRLKAETYICGKEFSAADCVVGHGVLWARRHGLCRGEPFQSYLSSVSHRPAFASAFADAPHFLVES